MAFADKKKERVYKAKYYQENKERLDKLNKSRNKAWRVKNAEKLRKIAREEYWDNKDAILKKQKKYYATQNARSREKTKRLTDEYLRKQLLKIGYTRHQLRQEPRIIEVQRLIILIKRELKKQK
jgi:hypothetical protein